MPFRRLPCTAIYRWQPTPPSEPHPNPNPNSLPHPTPNSLPYPTPHRDRYGTLDKDLYSVSRAGTKKIIEQYTDTTCRALDTICDADNEDIPDEAKLPFFNEARHAYGRTALMLSGGAYLGYYHMGVFKTLYQNKLMPRIISGASAGSLMAVVIGCKTDAELERIFNTDLYSEGGMMDSYRRDYFKVSTRINHPIGQSLQKACPQFLLPIMNPILTLIFDGKIMNYDIKHLQECCISNVGELTFQEAFDRTGRIINITVSPQNDFDPPRLLNYLTSPHVCVWSAACASCAIPGVFDAAELIVKEPTGEYVTESVSEERRSAAAAAAAAAANRDSQSPRGSGRGRALTASHTHTEPLQKIVYTDGSIESDLPMQALSELFNVNHFIISQVNPHSALFSTLSLRGEFNDRSWLLRALIGYTHFLKEQCKSWIREMGMYILSFKRNAPQWAIKRGLFTTVTQSYEGRENDITIMPWASHVSLLSAWSSVIKNPTDEEFIDVLHASARAVWENFSKIRIQCQVEYTLDQCVQRLRRKIAEKNAIGDPAAAAQTDAGADTWGAAVVVGDADVEEDPRPTKGMGDRTHSFYTSRSMLNLSGLSVSDPVVPILSDGGGRGRGGKGGGGVQFAGVQPDQHNDTDENGSQHSSMGGIDIDSADEATPPATPGRRPTSPGITKTTNMTNFYYRGGKDKDKEKARDTPHSKGKGR
jgi:TAG lipase/steryl ester hydrolase/phospholipase A2/LPA acyltransferase